MEYHRAMSVLRLPRLLPPAVRRPRAVGFRVAALLALVATALLPLGCRARESDARTAFELPSLDGRRLGPASFSGDVVVVDFWATWCAPCHIQADILEALHREYGERGIRFLAVNVGEEEGTVRSFVADRPFPYPVLLDEKEAVSTRLGVAALPSLMIVDRAGAVSYFRPGIVQEKRLRELLEQAAAATPTA
jgi:thiol-disulfide isomerase/thioredoxin